MFVEDFFGSTEGSFQQVPAVDHGYMERNWRLEDLVMEVMFSQAVDEWTLLDCAGEASADNWGVIGRYNYGSDWLTPLMAAVSDASIGDDQQARTRAVLSFYLAAQDLTPDFRASLSGILRAQRNMDPEAYQAALEEFTPEEQAVLAGAPFGTAPEN